MGERANGMNPADGQRGSSPRIEKEITALRDEIGDIVGELDRRRREAFDVRLQLQRHPAIVVATGAAVVLVLSGAVAVLVHNSREKQKRSYKARQLRRAFGRMIDRPERVARGEPPPSEKILAAIGTAAASLLVKRALERAVPRPAPRPADQAAPAAAPRRA